jgi:hypothetical protein
MTVAHVIKLYIKFMFQRFITHPKQHFYGQQIFEFVIEVAY